MPQPFNDELQSCYYCLGALLDKEISSYRSEIINSLSIKGIGSSVYYPQPVPRMKYYQNKYGYDHTKFLNATCISDSMIALPVGPHLSVKDMKKISIELEKIINQFKWN